jgi:hypothetical protein
MLLGVMRPGRGVDHPTHQAPKLKKQYGYTSTPALCLHTDCGFSVLFSQLQGKCQGKNSQRRGTARTLPILVVRLLFVLFCVLFVCKCVLPPGDNPIAVNKYTYYYYSLF